MCIAPGSACSPACPGLPQKKPDTDAVELYEGISLTGSGGELRMREEEGRLSNVKPGELRLIWLIWHTAEHRCVCVCVCVIHTFTWGKEYNVWKWGLCVHVCVLTQLLLINKDCSEMRHERSSAPTDQLKDYTYPFYWLLLSLIQFTWLSISDKIKLNINILKYWYSAFQQNKW